MTTRKTIIRDFDAVYQAKLWLENRKQMKRPDDEKEDLNEVMKGIVRFTYLTTGQLTFFYADIFDGIFLLNWGPDEIRNLLGLPRDSDLPITIYSPETEVEKLKQQIKQIQISSKFAYAGEMEGSSVHEWLFGEVEPVGSDEIKRTYEDWYEEKSSAWLKIIQEKKVKVVDWSKLADDPDTVARKNTEKNKPKKDFDLDSIVRANVKQLKPLPSRIVEAINKVLNMPGDTSTSSDESRKNRLPKNRNNIEVYREEIVNQRAAVLDYIDKLAVDNQIKFMVFWWWNDLYAKAIANKYHASYITFHPNVELDSLLKNNHGPKEKKQLDDTLKKLGIQAPNISKFKMLKQNLSSAQVKNQTLLIDGEILKDLMQLTKYSFSQVKKNSDNLFKEEKGLTGAKIYDVSYIISSFLDRSNTYRLQLRSARFKLALIIIPSIFVLFYESGFLFTHTLFKSIWIISVAFLGLPWKEITEMVRLRKSKLSARFTVIK